MELVLWLSLLCMFYEQMQRHRDGIANLMDTLRSILPPSEKQDKLSVLERTIEHINCLTEENKVCACHWNPCRYDLVSEWLCIQYMTHGWILTYAQASLGQNIRFDVAGMEEQDIVWRNELIASRYLSIQVLGSSGGSNITKLGILPNANCIRIWMRNTISALQMEYGKCDETCRSLGLDCMAFRWSIKVIQSKS